MYHEVLLVGSTTLRVQQFLAVRTAAHANTTYTAWVHVDQPSQVGQHAHRPIDLGVAELPVVPVVLRVLPTLAVLFVLVVISVIPY